MTSIRETHTTQARPRSDHGTAASRAIPQLRYQGRVAGDRTATASSTMPARCTASGPPSRAAHHWRHAIQISSAPPMTRATLTNGCLGTSTTSRTRVWTNSATPVGHDIQFTIIDGALSAGSHPRLTPAARVHAPKVATNTPIPATVAFAIRRRRDPVSCPAQTSTRNGNAIPALAFTAIPAVTSAMPPAGAPRRATRDPAASRPTTSRSLCPPPTMWITMTGFATAIHNATGTRPPSRRVSSGSAHTSRARPGSSAIRIRTTPRMMLSPASQATDWAIRMNSGP